MMALFLAVVGFAPPADDRIPVVLTTDCGTEVDDQWALTHLALSPRIDLRAVVTTHAPGLTSEASAKAARDVLDRLRLAQPPPVVAGSTVPLADRKTPRPNPGVDLILSQSRGAVGGRRLVVIAIGAATDVASALLTDPTLADRVDVVAMGFDGWPDGGDPWNVKNDVRAWQVLLDSDVPLVIGDGAVGKRDLAMSVANAQARLVPPRPPARFLIDLLDGWLKAHPDMARKTTGDPHSWPIWDEITVAYLLGLAETKEVPRPKLRDDLTFEHGRRPGKVKWVTSVRSAALWADLAACLAKVP